MNSYRLFEGLRCTALAKSFALAVDGFDFLFSISIVHELSSRYEKNSRYSRVSNPGPLGEKHERFLGAMQLQVLKLHTWSKKAWALQNRCCWISEFL